ncbi:hypothetical protein H5410_062191 [Solanum commersonii]|uniref:Uncharacterized protein n=1 Tax=Solanum commersonii TaxID=4109 RepID=A0A9J5W9Z3_SOLCO|nr:hypothetical protein H5410_062191 [Solanum commersonii]
MSDDVADDAQEAQPCESEKTMSEDMLSKAKDFLRELKSPGVGHKVLSYILPISYFLYFSDLSRDYVRLKNYIYVG